MPKLLPAAEARKLTQAALHRKAATGSSDGFQPTGGSTR
jgi:hypothetical protein